eukprot:7187790-Pyramimonas_sp.AAC.1
MTRLSGGTAGQVLLLRSQRTSGTRPFRDQGDDRRQGVEEHRAVLHRSHVRESAPPRIDLRSMYLSTAPPKKTGLPGPGALGPSGRASKRPLGLAR